jgi:hypothetical protein
VPGRSGAWYSLGRVALVSSHRNAVFSGDTAAEGVSNGEAAPVVCLCATEPRGGVDDGLKAGILLLLVVALWGGLWYSG